MRTTKLHIMTAEERLAYIKGLVSNLQVIVDNVSENGPESLGILVIVADLSQEDTATCVGHNIAKMDAPMFQLLSTDPEYSECQAKYVERLAAMADAFAAALEEIGPQDV